MAARLKYENDENEVHLIKKTMERLDFLRGFLDFSIN